MECEDERAMRRREAEGATAGIEDECQRRDAEQEDIMDLGEFGFNLSCRSQAWFSECGCMKEKSSALQHGTENVSIISWLAPWDGGGYHHYIVCRPLALQWIIISTIQG